MSVNLEELFVLININENLRNLQSFTSSLLDSHSFSWESEPSKRECAKEARTYGDLWRSKQPFQFGQRRLLRNLYRSISAISLFHSVSFKMCRWMVYVGRKIVMADLITRPQNSISKPLSFICDQQSQKQCCSFWHLSQFTKAGTAHIFHSCTEIRERPSSWTQPSTATALV